MDEVATGRISGERDAGLTVRVGWDSRVEAWEVMDSPLLESFSRGPKRSCEKVIGRGDEWVEAAAGLLWKVVSMLPPVNRASCC